MSALYLCLEHSRSVSYAHFTEQLCIELHLGDRSSHKETSSGCLGRIFAVRRVLDVSISLASRGDEFKRYRSHSTIITKSGVGAYLAGVRFIAVKFKCTTPSLLQNILLVVGVAIANRVDEPPLERLPTLFDSILIP